MRATFITFKAIEMDLNEQNILSHELLERSDALVVLESSVMIIIDVLAFTGNLLVCWAVYHNRNLRTVTNMYVVSLAISDGLMASLCIPFSVTLLVKGKWPFGFEVCQFFGFFCFFFGMVSLLLITATSVNRYFCVVRPNVYKRFFKVRPTFVSIVVILAVAASGAGLSLMLGWASHFVHYGKVLCFAQFRTAGEEKTYSGITNVFFIFIPITVTSCCYYKIVKTVKQHKREVHSSGHGRALCLNVKEINITKSLFAAVVAFGLCWGPVAVVDLVDLYTENKMAIPRQVFLMYVYLAFGSSAINPVIYGIMRKAFRAEFLRVLTFWRRKARIQPHQSDSEIQQPKRTSNQAFCQEV